MENYSWRVRDTLGSGTLYTVEASEVLEQVAVERRGGRCDYLEPEEARQLAQALIEAAEVAERARDYREAKERESDMMAMMGQEAS